MATTTKGASKIGVVVMTAGILGFAGAAVFNTIQTSALAKLDSQYRVAANEMRLLSQQISVKASETIAGEAATFEQLGVYLENFDNNLQELSGKGLDRSINAIKAPWSGVKTNAESLIASTERIGFLNEVSRTLETNIKPIQSEAVAIVDILRDTSQSADTSLAAQQLLFVTERIARNIDKILLGGDEAQAAADEFATDAASFLRTVDALRNGNKLIGVDKLTDADALASLDRAATLFESVTSSIDEIAQSTSELQGAARARAAIASGQDGLVDGISALPAAIDELASTRLFNRTNNLYALGGVGVFFVGLMLVLYRGQRARLIYNEKGVQGIKAELNQIAAGNLTVEVSEDNASTKEIARALNTTVAAIREVVQQVAAGVSRGGELAHQTVGLAEDQVQKGSKQTISIANSTSAATEMVQNSDEIANAAALTNNETQKNVERVGVGRDTISEVNKGIEQLRTTIQDLSKRTKKQGESSQDIASAIDAITKIFLKISVIAINARIEAAKAGEHGLPFMGVAEEISDLAREADQVSNTITQKARAIESQAGEVIEGMEATVAQVVISDKKLAGLNDILNEIYEGSQELAEVTQGVANAAAQSRESSDYVKKLLDQISSANLDISEISEANSETAQKINKMLVSLGDHVSKFQVSKDDDFSDDDMSDLESEDLLHDDMDDESPESDQAVAAESGAEAEIDAEVDDFLASEDGADDLEGFGDFEDDEERLTA